MNRILFLFLVGITFYSCQSTEKLPQTEQIESRLLDTIFVDSEPALPPYQATATKTWKLIHTALDLKFNFENQEVTGNALLTLLPYFYPQKELELDAKWMQISEVKNWEGKPIGFKYKNNKLTLLLDSTYTKSDTLKISIDYIAQPESNTDKGGNAITASKGIYFINPKGEEPNKPTQIWTQGETDFSSCWFPTLDDPNQKTTQEIKLTVEEKYQTLSNGTLDFSTLNGDGTRTDYWSQSLAHSPYLFMIAVGEFTITKEEWRGKEVSYYLEEEYVNDAKLIFGNTPEMLEYYSNLLGVEYPWDKYSQVVVRDFVSGAMENTSATLHGSFVQNHKRELLDYNPDGIIAHELFHQWFGDLVSCESWSNLPLNESFATYGEYLWSEYKEGKDASDYLLDQKLNSYLRESNYKQEKWVRFHYNEMDEMFDGHSYSKGSRILHMLRTLMGDDAFFTSLKLYLTRYAHQSAEMHQLRMCFEETTGEDWNWFFDQWAFASGHPSLNIVHAYDSTNSTYTVEISQIRENDNTPIYRLPIKIDVYTNSGKEQFDFIIEDKTQTFFYDVEEPLFVNVDAQKYLLCEKTEKLSEDVLVYKYENAPLYLDRLEALKGLNNFAELKPESAEIIFSALNADFFGIRLEALDLSYKINAIDSMRLRANLSTLSLSDKNPKVRAKALKVLRTFGTKDEVVNACINALGDSSYAVMANALSTLAEVDSNRALKKAFEYQQSNNQKMQFRVLSIYSEYGGPDVAEWMKSMNDKTSGYGKASYVWQFKRYVLRLNESEITNQGITHLKAIYFTSTHNRVKKECLYGLKEIQTQLKKQVPKSSEVDTQSTETVNPKAAFQLEYLEELFNQIKATETDSSLLMILD